MKRIFLIAVCTVMSICIAIAICHLHGHAENDVRPYGDEIGKTIDEVCRGRCEASCGKELVGEIVSLTNRSEALQKMHVVMEAMSKASFYGANMHDRESSHCRFHAFREAAVESLADKPEHWPYIIGLWFSETESLMRERDFCKSMQTQALDKGIELRTFTGYENDLFWHNCACNCMSLCNENIGYIVLWDDSVAAKYCATLPWWRKMMLARRIKKVIGRYPDWYQKKKSGK